MVLVNPPSIPVEGIIPIIRESNAIIADKEIVTNNEPDRERRVYMDKLRLDSSFYNAFRNTIRILLNKPEYAASRGEIEQTIEAKAIYDKKLQAISQLLRLVSKDYIDFAEFDTLSIDSVNEVFACLDSAKGLCESNPFCTLNGSTCSLVIPSRGLLTGLDNETVYYEKMADELIRYSRIRSFIFKPKSYLSFTPVNYNLGENEVILLQTILDQGYLDDLVSATKSNYVTSTAFDNAEPSISMPYDNVFVSKGSNKDNSAACNHTKKSNLSKHIFVGLKLDTKTWIFFF